MRRFIGVLISTLVEAVLLILIVAWHLKLLLSLSKDDKNR